MVFYDIRGVLGPRAWERASGSADVWRPLCRATGPALASRASSLNYIIGPLPFTLALIRTVMVAT
ncbi:hypothetical protein J6590_075366 [Homalodisca vitripennis]|nr:hypothetical protein J6590_075366 [Homalodisca vitripennis]